jgi:EmrB/QacA subfamily drug resistance transporter
VTEAAVRQKRWAILATVCLALAVIAINTTAINTALPAIGEDLDASASSLTWAVNAYLLAVAALVTVGGQLGDVFGKEKAFVAGCAVFAVGSICVAAAPDIWVVVLGRALQGTGSALLMPGTMAIISEAFLPEERGTAIGVWGAIGGICFAIGPLYGGFFTDLLSWRVIFWSDLVLLGIALILARAYLGGLSRGRGGKIDLPGAALLTAGLFLVVVAVEEGADWGWASPAFLVVLATGIVLLAAFVPVELRTAAPIVHFRLLAIRGFVGGNLATLGNAVGLIGLLYFFNLYVQSPSTFDDSALRASVVLLPYGVTMFFFSMVGGRVADRVGYRWPVTGFLLVGAAGFALFSRFSVDTVDADLWVPMLLAGIGVGATFSTSSAAGMVAVDDDKAGEAAGLINMSRYVGAVFVVTVGSILYGDPTSAEATVAGFSDANLLMATSMAVIAVACGFLLESRHKRPAPAASRTE